MKPALVVMAAGIGSRYGGIKQIDPVGRHGEAIIDFSVFDALRSGFGRIVFIIRRDIEKDMKEFVAGRFGRKHQVSYVHQSLEAVPAGFKVPEGRTKPWGTAQAVLAARDAVSEPFAVINADDFYGRDAYRVMAAYLSGLAPGSTDYAMMGYVLRNTLSEHGSVSRGICRVDGQGWLEAIEEHLKIERTGQGIVSRGRAGQADGRDLPMSGGEIASMNFFGFTPAIFPELERLFRDFLTRQAGSTTAEFYIPLVSGRLVHEGKARMKVLPTSATWFGITYREDRAKVQQNVEKLILAGEYPENLWA